MPTPHRSSAAGAHAAPDDRYLQTIADAIPAAAIYFDGAQRCRHANAAAAAWLDVEAEAMRDRAAADLFGAAHAVLQPYLARALRGEDAHSGHPIALPGIGRRASVIARPDGGSDGGDVHGAVLLLIDTSDTSDTGDSGGTSAPSESPGAAHPVDAAGIALRPGETIGLRISDIMGEEAFATLRRYVDAALDGRARQVEVRMPAAGDQDPARTMVLPERDEHGQDNGLVAAINDIARLRRTEEKLHRREQEFKTLVENSPDIITRFDCDMRHLYVNPAVERAFGKPASAYLGKTIAETGSPPQVVDAWEKATQRVFVSGAEERFDYAQQIDGRTRHFSARLIPEFDRGGNIESLLGITYDITDRTRMENERAVLLARERSARIQAETAARARDEFLAIVSHELRAPLNGIQSWAHVLESYGGDGLGTSMARRALQGIRTGVAQQVRLIEDLLDVTRMMSGRLRLVRQPFTLLPVIQAAVQSVRDMAAAKRIAISAGYALSAEQIDGDPDRVQQAVWNLLTNAIKFTPEGGNIWLDASAAGSEVRITVKDDGIGIAPEFLPQLFDRFSQKDTSSTRGQGGLGLGLFLVRYLLELHGGSVVAQSAGEGAGATFTVRLPLREEGRAEPPGLQVDHHGQPLPSLAGLHLLLIDDQEEARESLSVVLSSAGAKVLAATSASDALARLSLPDAPVPDMVVCDIAMPGEDGYAALRRLRQWKSPEGGVPLARVPAVALTAFSQREDRIKALTAGFQMHMTKPVAPEELIVVIDSMVARTQ